jgi:hypothetical protein
VTCAFNKGAVCDKLLLVGKTEIECRKEIIWAAKPLPGYRLLCTGKLIAPLGQVGAFF